MALVGNKNHLKYLFFLLSLLVVSLVYAGDADKSANNDKKITASEAQNKQFYAGEDWQLVNLKGEAVRLSDYQGQPVLLIFWATWCPYCKKLLPGIEKLHQKYHHQGLKVIAVNIREDWKPKVYWRNHEYTFDAVLDGDKVAELYGVRGTPGIVFIAPDGKVLGVQSFSDPEHPLLEKFATTYAVKK